MHPQGPDCARTALRPRAQRCVAGLALPCRRPSQGVSQAPLAVSLHPRASWCGVSQALCCAPCRAPYRRTGRHVAHLQRDILAPPSAMSRLSRDTTPAAKPPACHDTPIHIVTQFPNSQALAHVPLALARGPAVS